jgi:hypothetical protein
VYREIKRDSLGARAGNPARQFQKKIVRGKFPSALVDDNRNSVEVAQALYPEKVEGQPVGFGCGEVEVSRESAK